MQNSIIPESFSEIDAYLCLLREKNCIKTDHFAISPTTRCMDAAREG